MSERPADNHQTEQKFFIKSSSSWKTYCHRPHKAIHSGPSPKRLHTDSMPRLVNVHGILSAQRMVAQDLPPTSLQRRSRRKVYHNEFCTDMGERGRECIEFQLSVERATNFRRFFTFARHHYRWNPLSMKHYTVESESISVPSVCVFCFSVINIFWLSACRTISCAWPWILLYVN